MDQINYVMQKVNLIINLQNEQISIRNTREIHEMGQNSKNKHFFHPIGLSLVSMLSSTYSWLFDVVVIMTD